MATEGADILGTGWSFPPRFQVRGAEVVTVAQVQDVEESLRILLATDPGERVMQPAYGCGLRRMVFESMTTSRLTEIRSLVERAVLFFEPRIALEKVDIEFPDPREGRLLLKLAYRIRTTNTRHNLVYPLYLDEGSGAAAAAAP